MEKMGEVNMSFVQNGHARQFLDSLEGAVLCSAGALLVDAAQRADLARRPGSLGLPPPYSTTLKIAAKGLHYLFSATGVHSQILLTVFRSIVSRTSLKLKMAELDLFHSGLPPIDLSHHLNQHSKARHPSPLKDIIKFMGFEGMVSLAGGTIICNLQDMSSVAHGQA
jgi:hypothetical protein